MPISTHPRMVAQTRRISPGSGLNVGTAMPCARPERPAWSEPSPRARSSTSSLLREQPLDLVQDCGCDYGFRRLRHRSLAVARDEHDLVVGAVEADVRAADIVEDDEVG